MKSPTQCIKALLQQTNPARLLVVSRTPIPAVEHYHSEHPECTLTECPVKNNESLGAISGVYDLAIVADALEHLEHDHGLEWVGTIRNRFSPRICVIVSDDDQQASIWSDTDFYSLGMKRLEVYRRAKQTTRIYTYDLDSYNRKRAWNSPKNWANPENFGKYWW